jgi:hypothetical protein
MKVASTVQRGVPGKVACAQNPQGNSPGAYSTLIITATRFVSLKERGLGFES